MPKRNRSLTVDDQDELDQLMTNDDIDTDEDDDLSDQIQTLKDRKDNLGAGYQYISANLSGLRGAFDITPTQALSNIDAAMKDLAAQITKLEQLQIKRQNFANRVIKRRKGGYAGDGNCYISFVNVGMGDCTLVTTPNGVTILIDCGSDSLSDVILDPDWDPTVGPTAETYIRNNFKADTFLNGAKAIGLLLLTHPDGDHHNKLQDILSPLGVTASMCYYGGADAITAYSSSAYIKQIVGDSDGVLRRVNLRESDTLSGGKVVVNKTINDNPLPSSGKANQIGYEFVDPTTGAMVLYYENKGGSNFKISVLASNVTGVWVDGDFITSDNVLKTAGEMKCESTLPNKRSMIVLIECFKKKVLVCGDATAVTERFAVDYFEDILGNVQYLRMGHHGSPTSSSQLFVDAVEPKLLTAVASTGGEKTVVHHLPKKEILDLYVPATGVGASPHSIYAFDEGDAKSQLYFANITQSLYATGSNDTVAIAITGSAD